MSAGRKHPRRGRRGKRRKLSAVNALPVAQPDKSKQLLTLHAALKRANQRTDHGERSGE